MKNEKQSTGLIITVVVLVMLLLFGGCLFALSSMGYLSFDNSSVKEDSDTNDNVDEKDDQNETSKLPEWANYLLEQNITEITYETGINEYNEITNTEECAPAKTLTKEQLKDILLKMTESKLKKYDAGGFGGPCWGGIVVKYNNQEFKIYMSKHIVTDGNDSKIIALLEKENYILDNQIITEEPMWIYEYDWDTSYIDTLL